MQDILERVLQRNPICEGAPRFSPVNPARSAARGRTPHRFQPVFDRATRKELRRQVDLAVMKDYATNGPHYWDGRHEQW